MRRRRSSSEEIDLTVCRRHMILHATANSAPDLIFKHFSIGAFSWVPFVNYTLLGFFSAPFLVPKLFMLYLTACFGAINMHMFINICFKQEESIILYV